MGGKKDAAYITDLLQGQMEDLFLEDKHQTMFGTLKYTTDLIFFDGVSKVQKTREILTVRYLCTHCLKGAEHAVALFFSDITKLPLICVGFVVHLIFKWCI